MSTLSSRSFQHCRIEYFDDCCLSVSPKEKIIMIGVKGAMGLTGSDGDEDVHFIMVDKRHRCLIVSMEDTTVDKYDTHPNSRFQIFNTTSY